MKNALEIYHYFKRIFGRNRFEPIHETVTIEPEKPQRKHQPVTRLSKSGKRYRLIKHDANRKANSKAYVQYIALD